MLPERALHRVRMAFDETGHQHLVDKPFIQRMLAPGCQFFQ
jgi:hypothetical protein